MTLGQVAEEGCTWGEASERKRLPRRSRHCRAPSGPPQWGRARAPLRGLLRCPPPTPPPHPTHTSPYLPDRQRPRGIHHRRCALLEGLHRGHTATVGCRFDCPSGTVPGVECRVSVQCTTHADPHSMASIAARPPLVGGHVGHVPQSRCQVAARRCHPLVQHLLQRFRLQHVGGDALACGWRAAAPTQV